MVIIVQLLSLLSCFVTKQQIFSTFFRFSMRFLISMITSAQTLTPLFQFFKHLIFVSHELEAYCFMKYRLRMNASFYAIMNKSIFEQFLRCCLRLPLKHFLETLQLTVKLTPCLTIFHNFFFLCFFRLFC